MKQKGEFFPMLLRTSATIMLGNASTGKGVIKTGKGVIIASQYF